MADKVILTNRGALKGKYGAGLKQVDAAVQRLVAADKVRGIQTRVIDLDDAAAMRQLGATPVTNANDRKQNKIAIDGVYKGANAPDYLMILGSVDVVPHQDLLNPAYSPGDDDDRYAFGDLPYASDGPYGQRPEDFVTLTRVVGRLPDLTGGSDPAYLVGLLDTAAKYTPKDRAKYAAHLGVSADVWKGSTSLSLSNVFGSAAELQLSPPRGPNWGTRLKRLSHFFNCHGAPLDPQFYGQKGSAYPVAHRSAGVLGKLKEGTVCAAECCYGAELYDPSQVGDMGICNAYLASKAYGYFGSSTIAYGPASGNGSADLVCQSFLRRVLAGASTGRATLEARQDFIRSMSLVDPVDLKTLAQFSLFGDPSVHAVVAPPPHGVAAMSLTVIGTKAGGTKAGGAKAAAERFTAASVDQRRLRLATYGAAIGAAAPVVGTESRRPATPAVKSALRDALKAALALPGMKAVGQVRGAKALDVDRMNVTTFEVRSPAPVGAAAMTAKFAAAAPRTVHLALRTEEPKDAPMRQLTAVVATEQDGQIGTVRVLLSR